MTLSLTAIHPAYWLPGCTLATSLFILGMYPVQNLETVYALR